MTEKRTRDNTGNIQIFEDQKQRLEEIVDQSKDKKGTKKTSTQKLVRLAVDEFLDSLTEEKNRGWTRIEHYGENIPEDSNDIYIAYHIKDGIVGTDHTAEELRIDFKSKSITHFRVNNIINSSLPNPLY